MGLGNNRGWLQIWFAASNPVRAQLAAATVTENRFMRCHAPARLAMHPGRLGSIMDDDAAYVWNPRERVGENENGVALPKTVDQEQDGPDQAKPPKRDRHRHTLALLRNDPLHSEPGEKNCVPGPSDHFPDVPLNPQEAVSVPNPIREHEAYRAPSVPPFVTKQKRLP